MNDLTPMPGLFVHSTRSKGFTLLLKHSEADGKLWVCEGYIVDGLAHTWVGDFRVTNSLIESDNFERLLNPELIFHK